MALATLFLLAWILASRRPNTQEQLVIMWRLFVIGGCVILGVKSRYEFGRGRVSYNPARIFGVEKMKTNSQIPEHGNLSSLFSRIHAQKERTARFLK
jgi:hypothetical protein